MSSKPMPQIGDKAPALTLLLDDGKKVKLSDFAGEHCVVLYFYPKDDTPGCTKEACAFQKDLKKLEAAGAIVIGVSPDSTASHNKFRAKYGLNFMLAADEDKKAAEKYGVWVEKNMYGRKYMGVQRATFLIDKSGRIAGVWPKVKVEGHSNEVLKALKQ